MKTKGPEVKCCSLVIGVVIVTLIVSCNPSPVTTTIPIDLPQGTMEIVVSQSSRITFHTYFDLAQYSDIVILGTLGTEVGIINTARNVSENSKPDSRMYTVVPVFMVTVEQYIKGTGPSTIYVGQMQGIILHGSTPMPNEIEKTRNDAENIDFYPLTNGKKYLMFLMSIEVWEDYLIAGLKHGTLFIRTAHPWVFDASDPQLLVVKEVGGIEYFFPPQSLSEIIEQMNDPLFTPNAVPYVVPSPTVLINKDQPTATPATPYP